MTHKNSHNDLSKTFLHEIFNYDKHTGILRWKSRLSKRIHIGDVAGTPREKGRLKVGICNKEYFVHRIIWVWVTGKWPEYEVDHIDENQSNNRWKNLRRATPAQNHRNRGMPKNNTTGYKGVCFDRRRQCYIAGVKLNGKRHNIRGRFSTPESAYEAVKKLAEKLHGSWAKYI